MERDHEFHVDSAWLPERAGLIRLVFKGRQEKCLINRFCGWTHVLSLARNILGSHNDDTEINVLATLLVIDARFHTGQADLMRVFESLLVPSMLAGEVTAAALPGLPRDLRNRLVDRKVTWRLPLVRRLAPHVTGASASDRMSWVDIPAWLDAVEIVTDYKDGRDLADKRDLLVRDIPKSGFQRRLAPPPAPTVVEAMIEEFPNFQPVIEHTADQLAIAALGNGQLRLPAMLLLGEPGIGKSVFANALATTLGVRTRTVNLSHATQGAALGGTSAHWATGAAGEVFNALLRGTELNPVFILDEIDKATGTTEGRYNPLGPLYSLLEPEDAKKFTDEYAGVPIDASWFSWVATANDLHVLPAPITSRLAVFEIRSPTRAELRQIGRRQYRRLVDGFGLAGPLPPEAPAALLDQVEVSPRELRVILQRAVGKMARDRLAGREMKVELPATNHEQRKRMGFV